MSNELGIDRSGNGNNWTVNNITMSDQMVDSPTNNFSTLNPLNEDTEALAEGNLQIKSRVGGSGTGVGRGTIGFSSGKWYAEYLYVSGGNGAMPGISPTSVNMTVSTGNYYALFNGNKFRYTGNTSTDDGSFGAAFSTGDILGIAMDADNGTIAFYKNNALQGGGNAYTGLTDEYTFSQSTAGGTENIGVWNFGQDSSFAGNKTAQGNQDGNSIGDFYYTPPTGFLALCTKNLPDVDVTPSEHFNTVLYTGNGTARNITGVGFQPDFVWVKNRSTGTDDHQLYDAVRTGGKLLKSNTTGTEITTTTGITGFVADGFTSGTSGGTNANGNSIVSWNWKANGSGSANTNGSINTTATSANVDAGFSISTYTGTGVNGTIGHGLSKAPEMVIVKERGDDTGNWYVWHTGFAATDGIFLNLANAKATSDTYWNDTAPTSSVFSVGTNTDINGNTGTDTYVAYCFHSVDGYSKVGSYVGNGNADGTFIYLGFRPAFILYKNITDAGTNWIIQDNKRDTYNPNNDLLYPNATTAEEEDFNPDFLSNGLKWRTTSSWANSNGKSYIYIAFAESPFKNSNAK